MIKKYLVILLRAFGWGFMISIAIQGMVSNMKDEKSLIDEIKEKKKII